MGFLKEFKAFAIKGNVVDLAVAVIIGAAFGKIVSTLVTNVIMPPIGLLLGGVDFSNMKVVLRPAVMGADGNVVTPEVAIGHGLFINAAVDFVIIALAVFLMVKLITGARRKEQPAPAPPPGPTKEEELLGEIRDLLKNQPPSA